MKLTELDIIVAELMFPILVERASSALADKTIGYKEIADLIKERHPDIPEIRNINQRHIGRKLGKIWEFTKSNPGCPHIGALVVNKSGECGRGIQSVVPDLPRERERVAAYDWSEVTLNFDSYVTKLKVQKQKQERRRAKVSRDEAKSKVSNHWKLIKEESPLSQNDAEAIREALFQLVQSGLSAEEAFAEKLMELVKSGKKSSTEKAYVYLGEYVNAESGASLFGQYKIGYSKDLEQRRRALGGGVDGPLDFSILYFWQFGAIEAYAAEQYLHGVFAEYRKRGEFFADPKGVLPDLVDDEITQRFENSLQATNFGQNDE